MHAPYSLVFMVINVLCYTLTYTYIPYDVVTAYVMIIGVRLKGTRFRNLFFSNSFKIAFMYVQFFIIKPEVAGMTMMTLELSSQNSTEKSYICHPSISSSKDGIR